MEGHRTATDAHSLQFQGQRHMTDSRDYSTLQGTWNTHWLGIADFGCQLDGIYSHMRDTLLGGSMGTSPGRSNWVEISEWAGPSCSGIGKKKKKRKFLEKKLCLPAFTSCLWVHLSGSRCCCPSPTSNPVYSAFPCGMKTSDSFGVFWNFSNRWEQLIHTAVWTEQLQGSKPLRQAESHHWTL